MRVLDYYQVLRVAQNASRKEIEEAHQKLIKESRYDTSIDRRQVENAYRVLSDVTAKHKYDSRQVLKAKRNIRVQKLRLKKLKSLGEIGFIAWIQRRTLPQLLTTLAIVLTIAIIFYSIRFGYLLREFQAGDILYDSLSKQQFGKILKVEENHNFGPKSVDAYQIELKARLNRMNPSTTVVWLPQDTVKQRCYTKK
jgi:curved DNA-binding protein CbpA